MLADFEVDLAGPLVDVPVADMVAVPVEVAFAGVVTAEYAAQVAFGDVGQSDYCCQRRTSTQSLEAELLTSMQIACNSAPCAFTTVVGGAHFIPNRFPSAVTTTSISSAATPKEAADRATCSTNQPSW